MKAYLDILKRIMTKGHDCKGRNGMTREIFGTQIFSHDMSKGFPLLTTKQVPFHIVKSELLWFLSGSTNDNDLRNLLGGKWLEKNKDSGEYTHQTIWSANAADFKKKHPEILDGELGRIYGEQWRSWGGRIDQIGNLVSNLRQDPSSRRLVVSAWNPVDLPVMALPPCHMLFQCKVRHSVLDLCMIQRSCDMFLGVPFNIASYGLLLMMLAKVTNLRNGHLHVHLLDAHIYHEHFDAVAEQLKRETFPLAWVNLNAKDSIFDFGMDDIFLEHYVSHSPIKARMVL